MPVLPVPSYKLNPRKMINKFAAREIESTVILMGAEGDLSVGKGKERNRIGYRTRDN